MYRENHFNYDVDCKIFLTKKEISIKIMFNYFASKKASNFAYIYLAIKKAHKKQVKIVIGFDVILKLWPGVAEQGMALSNNFTALEFHTKKLAFAIPKVQYFHFVNMTCLFTTSSAEVGRWALATC